MTLERTTHTALLALLTLVVPAACGEDAKTDTAVDTDAEVDAGPVTDAEPRLDLGGEPGDGAVPPPPDAAVDAAPPPSPFCEGAVAHRWDPLDPAEPDFFPDGLLVRPEPTSPTGWRLELSPESAPWTRRAPALLVESLLSMNDLSGFGALGGALLRFTGPVNAVPLTAEDSVTGPWQWWDLSPEVPERVPFEAKVLEDGLTVVLWPLRPLRLNALHALVVTTDARADDGGCIAPAPTTRDLLLGETSALPNAARIATFAPTYRDAVARLGLTPSDVSVVSVFPTHDDLRPVRAAATAVRERPVAWGPSGGCMEVDGLIECEASTTVLDYRDARGMVDGAVEPREGPIPVTYWLPAGGDGPFPLIVYGHGLNSRRDEGRIIAERVTSAGFAVLAMEAVEHGSHPFIDPAEAGEDALRFLGLDLAGLKIDAFRLAGNFNQTNIDRVRLIGLLRQDGDPDGDGVPEFDTQRVAYIGASLGAMCGAGLLALSPDLDAAVLTIGGARLISVVTDTELVSEYRPIIGNLVGSVERFDRLVPIAQHVVDSADPGTWAAHVLTDRFDARIPPSVLANFGMSDEVVPPSAGRALARALGAPHLAPVEVPVDLVEVVEAEQLSGNRADGQRTAGFTQLATVTRNGNTEPAGHTETAKSDEVAAQIRAFLIPWAAGEVPVIVRP
jgi:dienelactone hydrolase